MAEFGFYYIERKMSLGVGFSSICIEINHPKKYAFVYDVQMIKQAILEPQDLILSLEGGGR